MTATTNNPTALQHMKPMQELETAGRAALRTTPFDHLRAIAAQIYRNGSKTDADAILKRVQEAEAEHAALVAVATEANQFLQPFLNMDDDAGSNMGELEAALEALRAVRAGSEVGK